MRNRLIMHSVNVLTIFFDQSFSCLEFFQRCVYDVVWPGKISSGWPENYRDIFFLQINAISNSSGRKKLCTSGDGFIRSNVEQTKSATLSFWLAMCSAVSREC